MPRELYPIKHTQTSHALATPVTNEYGYLDPSLLPPSHYLPINLNSTSDLVYLNPGEVAIYSVTNSTSFNVNLGLNEGGYEFYFFNILDVNINNYNGMVTVFLYPNGIAYSGQFYYSGLLTDTATNFATNPHYNNCTGNCSYNGFALLANIIPASAYGFFQTFTQNKVITINAPGNNSGNTFAYQIGRTQIITSGWYNNTTSWTMFGQISSPYPLSGIFIFKRII